MKKLFLDSLSFYGYPKKEIYSLAHTLGRRLTDFLGEKLFKLLLDGKILLGKRLLFNSDDTYKLHPAAKALEGFLNKVIKGKKLQESKPDQIGEVFGKKDSEVRKKIKDKKLIAKTKSVWDFCRNDVMHYSPSYRPSFGEMNKKYEEIIELIILLFRDFYGKTEPDEDINKGFKKYLRAKKLN